MSIILIYILTVIIVFIISTILSSEKFKNKNNIFTGLEFMEILLWSPMWPAIVIFAIFIIPMFYLHKCILFLINKKYKNSNEVS